MRTIAAACAIAACASHAPAPAPIPAISPDAGPPAVSVDAAPVADDLDPTALPAWAADTGTAVIVSAADADGAWVRHWLAPHDYVAVATSVNVTGRVSADSSETALDALADAYRDLRLQRGMSWRRGKTVSLEGVDLDARAVIGWIAAHEHRNLVPAARPLPHLAIRVDQTLPDIVEEVVDALGIGRWPHGNTDYLGGSNDLRKDLVRRKGPPITLAVRDATRGQVAAMLAAMGIDAGAAACDTGDPIELDLERAPTGVTAALIERLSGAPDSDACALSSTKTPIDGAATIATARAGNKRAALVRVEGEVTIVIGKHDLAVATEAPPPAVPGEHEIVERGRLAATLTGDGGSAALFELDGRWFAPPGSATMTIDDGMVTWHGAQGDVVAKLRRR